MLSSPVALLDAQSAARSAVELRTVGGITQLVTTVDSWGDPRQVYRFATQAGIIVGAGQRAVASLTETYLARLATIMTGQPVQPDPIAAQMGATRRNLPPGEGWEQVYARVATEYRVEFAASGDREKAFRLANLRAQEMASTDLGLAYRDQVASFMRGHGRQRREYLFAYRRVIRPELSQGRVCGLCIAASDRIYYRGDLLPLHARCHCEVMLITRDSDPGSAVNETGLGELYEQAGSTAYADLRRVKYRVEDHGELGPTLALVTD